MDWLTTRPANDDVLNPFAIVSLVVFAVALIACGFYSARPWSPPVGGMFSRSFVRRASTLIGWPAGIGLFFVLIRILQIDPATFGRPIWIVLSWILLIAALAYNSILAKRDHEAKLRNKAGHRPSQLARRPVRKKGTV